MEVNKENINMQKEKTKIPIPVQPLPALPNRLLQTKKDNFTVQQRIPLRTITSDNQAGPSHNNGNVRNKHIPLRVHTKFVTTRHGNYDLDWNYSVFKDDSKENKITASSDNEKVKKTKEEMRNNKNSPGVENRLVTPAPVSPPEPTRVKNIKRSLKRPHSRELQGLSPLVEKTKNEEEKYKRRLKFNEHVQNILESPNYSKTIYTKCMEKDYAEDLFTYMLEYEKPGRLPAISNSSRACVLNWIMKVNGPHGNPAVVQTALWYFDSALCVCRIQTDLLQQVASACYWIAQKIYGPSVTASLLVKYSNRAFSSKELTATEKAILKKLQFPAQPVVPQDIISYLSWWTDPTLSNEIEIAATFLCMCGMMVNKNLCTELPSAIAATSVHNALLVLQKRNLIQHLHNCPLYQRISKKVGSICSLCITLRRAVQIVSGPDYEYKAPLQHYGMLPHCIADKVVNYVNMSQLFDAPKIK